MSALSTVLQEAVARRGEVSLRQLAQEMSAAGHPVSFATVGVYLRGAHGRPEERVLRAFAAVLPGLELTRLRAVAGLPAGQEQPWSPPAQWDRLDARQRDALEVLVTTMVSPSVDVLQAVTDEDLVAVVLERPGAVALLRERLTGLR